MAANVFGTPITASDLEGTREYCYNGVLCEALAKVAFKKKNAEGKDVAARNFVKQLRDEFLIADMGGIMCMVYNATGDTVTLYNAMYWDGHACESHCPLLIANGQWGAFSIAPYTDRAFTSAAFIYEGVNRVGDVVTAFTASSITKNKVKLEIRSPTHYSVMNEFAVELGKLTKSLENSGDHCIVRDTKGASMYACIGNRDPAILEVILTLAGGVALS